MAIISILAVLLVVGGYWFFSTGPGWPLVSPRGSTVATFSGDSDQVTSDFRVREGWRIEWKTTGTGFTMAINGDQNMGTVVSVSSPDNGLTAAPSKGTFHVEVRASGPWEVKILQGR